MDTSSRSSEVAFSAAHYATIHERLLNLVTEDVKLVMLGETHKKGHAEHIRMLLCSLLKPLRDRGFTVLSLEQYKNDHRYLNFFGGKTARHDFLERTLGFVNRDDRKCAVEILADSMTEAARLGYRLNLHNASAGSHREDQMAKLVTSSWKTGEKMILWGGLAHTLIRSSATSTQQFRTLGEIIGSTSGRNSIVTVGGSSYADFGQRYLGNCALPFISKRLMSPILKP